MNWEIRQGDCVEQMAELEDASIDAIVCDPPYGLEFMGKTWDRLGGDGRQIGDETFKQGDARHGNVRYGGASYGQDAPEAGRAMQEWHHAWATEVLRVLKPGGYLLAFGGTRTYHRLACAIEDAGFEIRDSLLWLYGSGFPKSHNLDGDWVGWGTALKPSHEPIVVARKPLIGTVVANVQEHGTGALNIDGCRIEGPKGDGNWEGRTDRRRGEDFTGFVGGWDDTKLGEQNAAGRWPANVVLSPEAAEELDEQTGKLGGGGKASGPSLTGRSESVARGRFNGVEDTPFYGDSGGASRFFYCAKTSRAERNAGLDGFATRPMHWSSGEGTERAARNPHPTVKPINLMRWLVRLVTPPGGLVLDPFTGSGTTGCAAALEGFDFLGFERESEYVEIARARIAFWVEHEGREVEDVLGLHSVSEKAAREHDERGQMTIEEAA